MGLMEISEVVRPRPLGGQAPPSGGQAPPSGGQAPPSGRSVLLIGLVSVGYFPESSKGIYRTPCSASHPVVQQGVLTTMPVSTKFPEL